jgi:hypothetical protein
MKTGDDGFEYYFNFVKNNANFVGSILGRGRYFSLCHHIQTSSGAYPASYPVDFLPHSSFIIILLLDVSYLMQLMKHR